MQRSRDNTRHEESVAEKSVAQGGGTATDDTANTPYRWRVSNYLARGGVFRAADHGITNLDERSRCSRSEHLGNQGFRDPLDARFWEGGCKLTSPSDNEHVVSGSLDQ